MSAKGYTTETKIEDYTLIDIDASLSNQVDSWIEGMENWIDNFTGRNFIADEDASERFYDGYYDDTLIIDDCIEITKVEQGQDSYGETFQEIGTTGSDTYKLLPANYSEKGVPITAVQLISRLWTSGIQNNRITAKWGYSAEAPADVEFATTVYVAGIINAQRKDTKEIASEKIGNYSVSYATDKEKNDFAQAKMILDKYKRYRL